MEVKVRVQVTAGWKVGGGSSSQVSKREAGISWKRDGPRRQICSRSVVSRSQFLDAVLPLDGLLRGGWSEEYSG